MNNSITILMATYNGEKYLEEQINSIINQTYQNFSLIIQDDGSTDNTCEIIKNYVNKYPDKIEFIIENKKHQGACISFLSLIKYSNSEYIMFCDQDDFWKTNKIEITLKKMLITEKKSLKDTPILIHSDLKVVDKDLNIINKSYFNQESLNPLRTNFKSTLVQNNVVGCTMMINKPIQVLLEKLPQNALMHDWWIKLVVSKFGVTKFIHKSIILYRQHSSNCVGAQGFNVKYILRKVKNISDIRNTIALYEIQAQEFLDIYRDFLDIDTLDFLTKFSSLNKMNWIYKRVFIIKNNIFKDSLIKNLALLIFI